MGNRETIIKVSKVSIASNVLLCIFKMAAGIAGKSSAMVADGVHSLSDVLGSVLVVIGAVVSNRASDKEHQYGHERLECIISLILANILLLVGVGIGYNGVMEIIDPEGIAVPGKLALAAAAVSLIVKELLFRYTIRAAKRIDSVSLAAEAWHHRTDALSSVGSFIGILGAILGVPVIQSVACVLIAFMIIKVAIDIYRDTFNRLIDRACDDDKTAELRKIVEEQEGVVRIDDMKTRLFGSKIYVDIEIGCDESLSLSEAHDVAERVHRAVEQGRDDIKHCTVHVNPCRKDI